MSKKSRYYDGPGGIFYSPIADEIFTLKPNGVQIYNIKTHKIVGKKYDMQSIRGKANDIAITGMDHCVRLDDL